MKSTLSIIFIRHAEGIHNTDNKFRTAFDIKYKDAELTFKGIEQAKNLRKYLEKFDIDLVYCSPLTRCIQTMNYSLTNYDKEIFIDDRLIERLGADCVNIRKDKKELQNLSLYKINIDNVLEKIPEIEYFEFDSSVYNRIKSWYDEMIKIIKEKKCKKYRILVYSHAEILTIFFKYMFNKDEVFYNADPKEVIIEI